MKIEDLQKAWDKYSSRDTVHLDENAIKDMLGKRTKSVLERIDRNIKIGFFLVLALIIYNIVDYFIIYPNIKNGLGEKIDIPSWIILMDLLSILLFIFAFVYFAFAYFKVKNNYFTNSSLKETLNRTINILRLYERLFFFALIIILVSTSISYVFGLFYGISSQASEQGLKIAEASTGQLIFTILIGLVFLILLTGGIFLLFRWGFRKLYGNYLLKLKLTLKELSEIEEA